jgi:hypothetical protein
MLANKIIRYLTLAFGLAYAVIPIYMNYESLSLLTGQIVFFLLSITPFFTYLFFSRKETKLLNLLLPSVPICILYALLLSTYFESTSSTSALVFIIAPIMGFGLLIVAYLILYLISKFKPKTV